MPTEEKEWELIYSNTAHLDLPHDPAFPYRLDITLRTPSFMAVAHVCLHGGGERFGVIGKTKEALVKFLEGEQAIQVHPRLSRIAITHPDGKIDVIFPAPKNIEGKSE